MAMWVKIFVAGTFLLIIAHSNVSERSVNHSAVHYIRPLFKQFGVTIDTSIPGTLTHYERTVPCISS